MSDYIIQKSPLVSGIGEAASRKYIKLIGKSGKTWLVADQPAAGEHIYVSADERENKRGYAGFRGFGGAKLSFKLTNGETIELVGPWHSNSQSLFEDTGYDVRDMHTTFVVVALGRHLNDKYETVLTDVLYKDEHPMIGKFERGTEIAQKFADQLGESVIRYSKSRGGSICGPVSPASQENH